MRVLLDENQVRERVAGLAAELDRAYAGSSDLVLVGVLRGAVYFLSDLSRAMRTPHRIDFVEYVSYSGTSKGTGNVIKECSDSLLDADVVLVDEICDTGETLEKLRRNLLLFYTGEARAASQLLADQVDGHRRVARGEELQGRHAELEATAGGVGSGVEDHPTTRALDLGEPVAGQVDAEVEGGGGLGQEAAA